jgi:hypothetical protein
MNISELNELTEDFFNRTEEEQNNCIENFSNIFLDMMEDPDLDYVLLIQHIESIIKRAEEEEMFETSHIFLQVKKNLIDKRSGM